MSDYMHILENGGIGVMPTDTIYGIVGSALNPSTVERMYTLKDRNVTKPFIVLISSVNDIARFGITLSETTRSALAQYWPGPVSIILPCEDDQFTYLHRDKCSLAFRFPRKKSLVEVVEACGPLAAPSANPEGLPPATTIQQAKDYFGERVDFYIDGGTIIGTPSKLISFDRSGTITVLRE